jgi:GNAT superfamily N-acetyltransferase
MSDQRALVRELERIERDAWAEMIAAAPAGVAGELGLRTVPVGQGSAFVCATLDAIQFNRVCGLGVFEPARLDDVDAAIAAYASAGVKNWAIHFADGAEGLELAASQRGFAPHRRTWMKFARDAAHAPPAPSELAVRELGAADGQAFGRTAAAGFALPRGLADWLGALPGRIGWRCYGAFDGADLAAVAALFIDGPSAWFGIDATMPDQRGRGAQSALLAARIEAARDAGCTILAVETGIPHEGEAAPSFKNILRAGFVSAYPRPNLARALV